MAYLMLLPLWSLFWAPTPNVPDLFADTTRIVIVVTVRGNGTATAEVYAPAMHAVTADTLEGAVADALERMER